MLSERCEAIGIFWRFGIERNHDQRLVWFDHGAGRKVRLDAAADLPKGQILGGGRWIVDLEKLQVTRVEIGFDLKGLGARLGWMVLNLADHDGTDAWATVLLAKRDLGQRCKPSISAGRTSPRFSAKDGVQVDVIDEMCDLP